MQTANLNEIREALTMAVNEERLRAAKLILIVRMVMTITWTLAYFGYYIFLQDRLQAVLPLLFMYSVLSILLYIFLKNRKSSLKRSLYLFIFMDIPLIFFIQYVTMKQMIWSEYLVVSFAMMFGMVCVLVAQLLFSRRILILTTFMGIILSMMFFSKVGLSSGWPSIILVFGVMCWVAVYFQKRLFSLLTQIIEYVFEQKRLRQDLALAREIQKKLLPAQMNASFPVHGLNLSYYEVSGDFYDYFILNDGRIYFCVADVCGKGLNASLLMAKTSSLFHCLGKTIDSPGRLLAMINNELVENNNKGRFVTMVGGILDPVSNEIKFANAGHEPPVLFSEDKDFSQLKDSSLPLGIEPGIEYPEISVNIADKIFYVFTDGLTEMRMKNGEQINIESVMSMFRKQRNIPRSERLQRVLDDALENMCQVKDDITMLVVENKNK